MVLIHAYTPSSGLVKLFYTYTFLLNQFYENKGKDTFTIYSLTQITITCSINSFHSIIKSTTKVNFLENNQRILLYFFLNIPFKKMYQNTPF